LPDVWLAVGLPAMWLAIELPVMWLAVEMCTTWCAPSLHLASGATARLSSQLLHHKSCCPWVA